jgi:hypothetical protein
MFVKVAADRSIHFEDRENFRTFKLVVDGRRDDLDAVRQALAGIADVPDAETAWIFEDALRRWPAVAADAGWQQSFGGMMDKAKPHGWIDEQRKAIKAHIEWVG